MLYAVTGSTGSFGSLAVQHLLSAGVPASSLVALVRDKSKAAGLEAKGVQVRVADYDQRAAFENALKGVDRLLLVSSNAVGQRLAQHQTAIDAAKAAGVKLLVYTSLAWADTSTNPLAPDHKGTEAYLRQSGLPFVILRNNWYTENYADDVRFAKTSGIIATASGEGRVASASRTDYAEAAAKVLIGDGHTNRTYELSGDRAWSFAELAAAAGEVLGRTVTVQHQTAAERKQALMAVGLPEGVAEFVTGLDLAIAAGTLAKTGGDLARLLGRAPLSLKEGLTAIAHKN